jgi:hypothetical protein
MRELAEGLGEEEEQQQQGPKAAAAAAWRSCYISRQVPAPQLGPVALKVAPGGCCSGHCITCASQVKGCNKCAHQPAGACTSAGTGGTEGGTRWVLQWSLHHMCAASEKCSVDCGH